MTQTRLKALRLRQRHSGLTVTAWNDRKSRYSQPKIELYSLFRTLRALRVHIIGVTNLVIEMDAQYVKGMLNNPDVQPNAAMNQWIAASVATVRPAAS